MFFFLQISVHLGHSFGNGIQKEGYFAMGCRCKHFNLDSIRIYIVISSLVCLQFMGKSIENFAKQYKEVLSQDEEDEEMDVDGDD